MPRWINDLRPNRQTAAKVREERRISSISALAYDASFACTSLRLGLVSALPSANFTVGTV